MSKPLSSRELTYDRKVFFVDEDSRLLEDKTVTGWLVWSDSVRMFLAPSKESTFQPWNDADNEIVSAVREVVTQAKYWKSLSVHLAEEIDTEATTQDNISCVKSICKLYTTFDLHYTDASNL